MVTRQPGRTNACGLVIVLIISVTLAMLLLPGQLAFASQLAPFRGADLTGPEYSWPFVPWNDPSYWWNLWGNQGTQSEVNEYMSRLEGLGFNAIRCMLFCDASVGLSWDSAMENNLCAYIDMAATHHLKIYFYISLTNPSYDDDPGNDPNNNDARVMPDGSIPSPCITDKNNNLTLYNAVVNQAKAAIDKTVWYTYLYRQASNAIIGWSVGYGEDTQSISSAQFLSEIIPYVKLDDPYHLVGIECKSGPGQVINNQIVFLPNAPGHNDSQITARDIYSYLDFIGIAHYDLDDNVERMCFTPWNPVFFNQMASQNPSHKPVILEEYGTDKPETTGASYLLQRVASDTGSAADWQGTFLWDAHVYWDSRPDPNRYGMLNYDSSQPYFIGSPHTHGKVLAERYSSHPWASYTFDDKTSVGTGLDGQGYCDLSLYNGAYKYYAKTGYGLILDGTNDYAMAGYNSLMSHGHLYFEAWVDHTAAQLGCIASRNGCWTLLLGADNKLHLWANTGSGWAGKMDSTGTISTNTWTRVAISYDGKYWRIYKNGTLDSSVEDVGSIHTNSADLGIGITGGGTAYYFQGAIDEVQLCPIPGPLVRLKCDESNGSTLSDSSGNGLSATLYGGYDRSVAQVLPDGYAINFNGSTGYATVSNTSSKTTGNIGVDFWMYPRNSTSLQYVISQGRQGSNGSGWGLYIYNGYLYFEVNTNTLNDGHDVVVSRPISNTYVWSRVRADYNGTTARLSIDGATSSAAGTGPIVYRYGEDVTLGRLAYPAGWYYFNGVLDEAEVYSTSFEAPW